MVIASHLEHNEQYRAFYLETLSDSDYILLDNGIIEEGVADAETMMKWQELLSGETGCHITVIAPDVWKDSAGTLNALDKFVADYAQHSDDYKVMAVPHGETISDFVKCMESMAANDEVDIIGLPYKEWSDPMGWTRVFMLTHEVQVYFQDVHLLGLWSVPEIQMMPRISNLRSVDTSLPFRLAAIGEYLQKDSINTDRFNWQMKLSNIQLSIATQNIKELSRICDEQQKVNIFSREFRA